MFKSFSTHLRSRISGHGCVSRSSMFLCSSKCLCILFTRSLTRFIAHLSVSPLHSGLRGKPELYESRAAELVMLAGVLFLWHPTVLFEPAGASHPPCFLFLSNEIDGKW